jgi:hypothetical protein
MDALETVFRDPATPTRAQAADATSKLFAEHIISLRQARRDMGYSPAEIQQMETDDADEEARLATAGVKAIASAAAGGN